MSKARHETPSEPPSLAEIIAKAAEILPEQGPLQAFVHHNTLHHFEHLPFTEGVLSAAQLLGGQPYQSEAAFRGHLQSGRILPRDIDAVLEREPTALNEPVFPGGPTLRVLRAERLRHPFDIPRGHALDWLLQEDSLLEQCHAAVTRARRAELVQHASERFRDAPAPLSRLLQCLWDTLETGGRARASNLGQSPLRVRDKLWSTYGVDTDLAVHSLLIRFTSSYLDQGLAYWAMPRRDLGMLNAFRALYGQPGGPPDTSFHGLAALLRHQHDEAWSAAQTIEWALERLEVARQDWLDVIRATLQSLRGWAGMVRQFQLHPERAPVNAPPAALEDYLAIQLLLDVLAAQNVVQSHPPACSDDGTPPVRHSASTYEAFVFAQLSSVDLGTLLHPNNAKAWLDACASFDELERRRLWHLAYERHYHTAILDALHAHLDAPAPPAARPAYQAVFCIDDREESLRRHLEEALPNVQTFGYAGFFGVAMQYQGLGDVRPRALCPVAIEPQHLVREVPVDVTRGDVRDTTFTRSHAEHAFTVGSRTLVRGGLLATGVGLAALVPLVGRSLFPRATQRWLSSKPKQPRTRLELERAPNASTQDGLHVGFTIIEMANIVAGVLATLGLGQPCPLVLVVGHGSSSLNNPHKAAYDCGATGGGRGGPNARAFAAMANHPAVRQELERRGQAIPSGTHFVGGYHDTADDSMTYFDIDAIPAERAAAFEELKQALAKACERDAHERCRRFVHAPLGLSLREAHRHVEARAVDIGQPRPECGHATNAVCVVGRRERTRGLFLDRRAFLVTYDPTSDPTGAVLGDVMQAVAPVGAGINLEYYFSYVDPKTYGCGSKLPHNVVGLFGVMDGHASDLRTGLPWQMVEIHEPVRLLTVVEATPATLERLLDARPNLATLVKNEWIVLVAMDPHSADLFVYRNQKFEPYHPQDAALPTVASSFDAYRGNRAHLPCVRVSPSLELQAHP